MSPETAAALAEIYRNVDAALGALGTTCEACGECCRFGPDQPVLFASAVELAFLVDQSGKPAQKQGPKKSGARWRCPYQSDNRCGARRSRTLGCRTYFCKASVRRKGERIYAEAIPQIRAVSRDGRYPWWYGPARIYLEAATEAGSCSNA